MELIDLERETLTDLEKQMLKAFIMEGIDCNGAESVDALIQDNMTWADANDLQKRLGWSKQSIGGVMSSLESKGMIDDSGEPLPERRINAWTASDKGIRIGWELLDY